MRWIALWFSYSCARPCIWEQLGRTIATFGFLEEILGKAIFAFTATQQYPCDAIDAELKKWEATLELALAGQLQNLIEKYIKSVRNHQRATIVNLEDLERELLKVPPIRNALCHGSWRQPDEYGASIPFYFNRAMEKFDTPVNVSFLQETQTPTRKLAIQVMNTVTHMGWKFPGSNSPGEAI